MVNVYSWYIVRKEIVHSSSDIFGIWLRSVVIGADSRVCRNGRWNNHSCWSCRPLQEVDEGSSWRTGQGGGFLSGTLYSSLLAAQVVGQRCGIAAGLSPMGMGSLPMDGKPERHNKWLFQEIVCLPLDDRKAWDAWKGSSLSILRAGKTVEIE
jgi:hypothetical protein